MVERRSSAVAAGDLHAGQCGRLARRQGSPALPPVESTTLLGADPPRDNAESPADHQGSVLTVSKTRGVRQPPTVEVLTEEIGRIVAERQELRAAGAAADVLEANRRRLTEAQHRLSQLLIERHLPAAESG